MESQAPPSKLARLSNSRTRLASGWNVERNRCDGESGSPPLGLGLELGRVGSSRRPIISCKKLYGTKNYLKSNRYHASKHPLQLQELQLQSLICTYIQAGFPVPYHLVLPIWRSVATSHGGLSSRLYQLYPSLMGCNPLYLAYKKGMEPEPGRCRRTDGKKWRCSKEALPYTEDASVQESLRNLLPMVIPAPTSPFPYLLESVVLAPGSGHLIISFQDVVSLPRVFFMEARKEK